MLNTASTDFVHTKELLEEVDEFEEESFYATCMAIAGARFFGLRHLQHSITSVTDKVIVVVNMSKSSQRIRSNIRIINYISVGIKIEYFVASYTLLFTIMTI